MFNLFSSRVKDIENRVTKNREGYQKKMKELERLIKLKLNGGIPKEVEAKEGETESA